VTADKRCSRCRESLPAAMFTTSSHRCRPCMREVQRVRRGSVVRERMSSFEERKEYAQIMRTWRETEPGPLIASFNRRDTWLLEGVREAA
jgi:hypothetical protein